MSYTVVYNPELRKTYPMKRKKLLKLPVKPIITVLVLFIALYAAYKAGFIVWLLPGDAAVTTGAFSSMVEDVRSGQTVTDAIFSFFRNVISNGAQ